MNGQRHISIIHIIIRPFFSCLVSSIITASILQTQIDQAVGSELFSVILWTVPLAIGLALASLAVFAILSTMPRIVGYGLALLLGTVAGFVWTMIVYSIFVNPYFGVFSTPVTLVWIAGGIGGLFPLVGISTNASRFIQRVEVILVILLCLVISFLGQNLFLSFTQVRELNTVWIRWYPGASSVIIDDQVKKELTEEELIRIESLKLGGLLTWQGSDIEGEALQAPKARMIIVMHQPIKDTVELILPADPEKSIIYIQQLNGNWYRIPPDASLLKRTLRLAPNPVYPNITSGYYPYVGGGTSISGGINWSGERLTTKPTQEFPDPTLEP